ncbi:MAG: hypothetical protein NT150_02495 [Bacteroidetes bacterium]|nr:hypothetical protein [Bacteroidota bacterium]
MKKNLNLILSIFTFLLITEVSAQTVYFTGLGRALVSNGDLSDNTNTASKLKASGGYTLFDLGIYAKPNEVLRGGVILRVKNPFGGFYGNGASLAFRQMQLEGLIAKKVKYEIGDVYLSHTPFTLWNADSNDTRYEADIFAMRRDIINYENYFVGNAWRMQGFNTKAKINFTKGIENIGLRVYGGRTRETNYNTIPDRYFYGGRIELNQSAAFKIAGNVAAINDIAGTVKNSQVNYDNKVFTSDFALNINKLEKFKFSLLGEAGASQFQLWRKSDSVNHKFEDFFYDLGLEAAYKPLNITLGLSYRDVGFNFNSPMAQTRRMNAPTNIALSNFGLMNDGITARPFSPFDPLAQDFNLYNQGISTTLMNYFVQYNMVEPYGKATPNRRGFTISASIKEPSQIINADVQVNLLSEIVSEGDSIAHQKREFTLIRGGFTFNLHKLLQLEKVIAINGGIRTESSTRGSSNLASTLIDAGLDVEVMKSLHLLGGVKLFSVKGNETQSGRNELNQIVTFSPLHFNQTQNIIAAGVRYNYDKAGCFFSMHYHIVNYNDADIAKNKYTMNQLFFVFGLKF